MKIGINASFLRKKDSGIGQVTFNFLQKLKEPQTTNHKPQTKYILYLEEDIDLDLPENFSKKVVLPLYKRDDLVRKLWWEKHTIPKQAGKDGCDIFFSLYQSASIFKNIPHLMLVHDVVWKIFPEYLGNLRKKIYHRYIDEAIKKAGKIITISENSKKDIENFYKIKSKEIVVDPVNCDPIFKEEKSEEEKRRALEKYGIAFPFIFYVGGFDVRKNVNRLIDGYAECWQKHSSQIEIPKLVLGGKIHPHLVPLVEDIPAKISEVCREFGVPEEQFRMVGFVEQADLPAIYQSAKALCYPSLYEGFGLPIVEAMNSECPVITSNASSIPEIADGGNAFIVDPENAGEISEAIFQVISNEELAIKKVKQAKIDAGEYSWDDFVEKVLREIKKTS